MMDTRSLIKKYPQVRALMNKNPLFWRNPDYGQQAALPFSQADLFDAVARWERFAPYLERTFPETIATHGIIESPLIRLEHLQESWTELNSLGLNGKLFLKADNQLPISGSIKSRGGIYEILKFAEQIAMVEADLVYQDNYQILASAKYRKLFANYGVIVTSTGNLALGVGIVAAAFGFKTTVYMSHDARQWKKDKLRANGVTVKEFTTDFPTSLPKPEQMPAVIREFTSSMMKVQLTFS
nr:D-serine ammonia-lyase [Liquorilactobacillus satsumensis]